ncbi:hypothetical protein Trydic_g21401 [Trypoxylus dichotomus]
MAAKNEVELPDQGDNVIRTKDLDVVPNQAGIGHEVFTHLKKHGDKIAQIEAETGITDTYDQYFSRILRVALHLKERGIKPDDVIAPCTMNHLNTAVVFVAPLLIGAKVACFDPRAIYSENKRLMDLIRPKLMFADEEAVENLEKIIEELNLDAEIVVFGSTTKHTPFEDFLKLVSKEEEDNFEPYEVKDLSETAIIVLSSGCTGVPKGLCISQYALLCQLFRMMQLVKPTGILYSPIAWASGQMFILLSIFLGTPKLICEKFTPEKTWRYLTKYQVPTLTLASQDAMLFLQHGSKISTANKEAISKLFLKPVLVISPYGQSEIYGPAFSMDATVFAGKPASCGKPIQGFWYKIVDPATGKICGPGEQGELLLKSKFCMNGYYNSDASNCFDSDGFLKTGDIAYYDDEHCFYIVERVGERLRYKSHWISPAFLENILYEHPAVKVACVIGVISGDGDTAIGIVVKREEVAEEELVNFVNDRVDDIEKLQGGIIFVDDDLVPYTFSGKIRRFLVRKAVLEKYKSLIKSRVPTMIDDAK